MDHWRFWFFRATGIGGSKMIYRSIWLIWNLPGQLIKQATTPIFHFLKSPNWGKGCRQPMPPKIIRRYGSYTDGSTDFLPKPIPLFWLRVESVCWPYGSSDGKNLCVSYSKPCWLLSNWMDDMFSLEPVLDCWINFKRFILIQIFRRQ